MVDLSGFIIDALYIPEFHVSLLSVSELNKLEYKLYFHNALCSLKSQQGSKQLYYPFAYLIDGLYEGTDLKPNWAGGQRSTEASQLERAYYAWPSSEKVYKNLEWNG